MDTQKAFNKQYALLPLNKKSEICLDKNGFAGAIIIDLSKASDTMNHKLVIAELQTGAFYIEQLQVLLCHLQGGW